jgi:hypothetical protein
MTPRMAVQWTPQIKRRGRLHKTLDTVQSAYGVLRLISRQGCVGFIQGEVMEGGQYGQNHSISVQGTEDNQPGQQRGEVA